MWYKGAIALLIQRIRNDCQMFGETEANEYYYSNFTTLEAVEHWLKTVYAKVA
jgi:hypothetical protein